VSGMRVEARVLISSASDRPPSEAAACFTGLARLADGTLFAAFQCGRVKHAADSTVKLFRSTDAGHTWREVPTRWRQSFDGVPGSLTAGEIIEAMPGRLLMFAGWFERSDPARPLFNPATEGILPARQLVAESADGGWTWSDWRELPTPGLTGTAVTGPAVAWPGGTVAFAFESFKEYHDPSPPKHGAWLLVSRDAGRTFGPPWCVARDPADRVYYWDQRLCRGPRPGEFVALFWAHDRARLHDLNVHLLRATLDDLAGPHPPRPRELPVPGQIAAPLLLPDGRLLAFVVDRGRPGTLTLWLSPDGGVTWPADRKLVAHTHDERAAVNRQDYLAGVDFAAYWEDMGKWSFGHPALVRLGGTKVLAAFYAGPPGQLSVHWVRIDVGHA
jgi:hypothetical protein